MQRRDRHTHVRYIVLEFIDLLQAQERDKKGNKEEEIEIVQN